MKLVPDLFSLIAGSSAGSLWFSQEAFRRAGSRDKGLHIVEGATHIAIRHARIRQGGHGPARAAIPKRKQGFIAEQLRRAAERACCNGCRGIRSVTGLRQCRRRSALHFFASCLAINGMLDDLQAPWGGFKYSGLGRDGTFGIEAFS
jgi:hypothetical protein